jgi:hypothetical protein
MSNSSAEVLSNCSGGRQTGSGVSELVETKANPFAQGQRSIPMPEYAIVRVYCLNLSEGKG